MAETFKEYPDVGDDFPTAVHLFLPNSHVFAAL
jgi:hypothetical protein